MRLKQFAFLLLITLNTHSLLSEENDKLKKINYENDIQDTLRSKNSGEIITHVVKKGDTLSSISKKYSIKKELIIKANKILDENYIFIGQNLKIIGNLIPEDENNAYHHEVKKGENLTEIANKYNLSVSKLVLINGIENQDILKVGTKLKLKEEISSSEKAPIIELEGKEKIKKNNYGPLLIMSEKTTVKKGKKFLEANHENGKRLIIQINCDKKEINVRGIGRKWKGWMPARELFEIKLLNDFC